MGDQAWSQAGSGANGMNLRRRGRRTNRGEAVGRKEKNYMASYMWAGPGPIRAARMSCCDMKEMCGLVVGLVEDVNVVGISWGCAEGHRWKE